MSRTLVIISTSMGASARDGVDAALAALAYEHPVSMLLIDNGVTLLAPDTQPGQHGLPDLARSLAALVHHGVDAIVASADCLQRRGIVDTSLAVRSLRAAELSSWIAEHRHVHRF